MSVRSLIAGIAIGLAAGYAIFATGREETRATRAPTETGTPEEQTAATTEPDPPPAPTAGKERVEIFRSGAPNDIRRSLGDAAPTETEVEVLLVRLDSARAAGDRQVFDAVLRALLHSGSEKAQQKLLDLMCDETLPDLKGREFFEALKDSRIEDVADAARRRVELNLAAGETSWVAVSGWFDLALWRGDETHLDWMLTLAEDRFHQIHRMAMKALGSCPSPHAVQRVAEMIRGGEPPGRVRGAPARARVRTRARAPLR
jgi:hypothetical protein